MDPKPQTTATSSPENSDELAEQESLLVLPLEVLSRTLDYLEDVKDLANVAMTCREWRELINSCDECWEHAFMRDYNQWSAKDYDNLPTWRQRYIACTLDITCLKLRDKAEVFDELEDTTAALERLMQDLMGELSRLDKTISEQKFELNTHLETISGHPSIHVGSTLGRTILQAAGAELKSNGFGKHPLAPSSQSSSQSSSSSDGEEPWRDNLTPEVCQALRHAATEINQATQQVAEKRDALRNIVDALSVQQASTKKARESIRVLKDKRASLEAATRYRHTMRRR